MRFAAEAKAFRPTDDVDNLIAKREPRTTDGDASRQASEMVSDRSLALGQMESPDERNLGPYTLGTIATAHGFGGSLPELGRVRVRW